jgi:hypothetical protein
MLYGTNPRHSNTAESFFALLKRGRYRTFHRQSKQHLFRYCHEFGFRWTFRKVTDGERTARALEGLLAVDPKQLMKPVAKKPARAAKKG